MPLKLGPLKLPWPKSVEDDDPYWQFFLNEIPVDPKNVTVMGYTPEPGEGTRVREMLNLNPPTDCSTCHR